MLRWEIVKLVKQSSTYYALIALLIIEGFVMLTAYFQGRYILDTILTSLRESFIFEGDLLNGNLIIYIVLNSLWFHVPLILMIVTSGIVANEYRDGTIQSVLLQGVKRKDYILGKYMVAIFFTLAVLFLLALTTIGFSYFLFGTGDLVVYFESLNIFEKQEALKRIIGAFISGTNSMIFYAVISVTLGIIFKEPMKAWILSGLFLILVALLMKVDFGGFVNNFLFFKLTNSWQQFFNYEPDYNRIMMNNLTLLIYSGLVAFSGIWLFKKMELE